jgi:hypothetical protein
MQKGVREGERFGYLATAEREGQRVFSVNQEVVDADRFFLESIRSSGAHWKKASVRSAGDGSAGGTRAS